MDTFTIYKLTCSINNKLYVGYTKNTLDKRFTEHVRKSKGKTNTKLYNAMRKYGINNFTIEALEITNSKQIALELEIQYIKKLNTLYEGYNMTIGGDGGTTTKDRNLTQEHKNKISEALIGVPKSKKHKQSLKDAHADFSGENNPFYGKTHSEESIQKIGNREYKSGTDHHRYGKSVSTSFKSGVDHPRSTLVTINGIKYGSIREASAKLNINTYQIRKMLV